MNKEIWKNIKGFEGLYEVSNLGNIKSLSKINKNKNKLVAQRVQNNGYIHVCLSKNGKTQIKTVHRIVAQAFLPPIEGKKEINHINGIKTDNRAENLEWVSHRENVIHAISNGLFFDIRKIKDRSYASKPVAKIKDGIVVKTYKSMSDAAKCENISLSAMQWRTTHNSVVNGYSWKHL